MTDLNLVDKFEKALLEWKAEAASVLLEIAKRNAPRDTGKFATTLYPRVLTVGPLTTIEIRSDSQKPKAIWIREGTKPHTIQAVSGRSLAWQDTAGGDTIFATSVNHPGTQPSEMERKTIDEAGPILTKLLADKIKKL